MDGTSKNSSVHFFIFIVSDEYLDVWIIQVQVSIYRITAVDK